MTPTPKEGPPFKKDLAWRLRVAKNSFLQIEAYAAALADKTYVSKGELLDVSRTAGTFASRIKDEDLERDEKQKEDLEICRSTLELIKSDSCSCADNSEDMSAHRLDCHKRLAYYALVPIQEKGQSQ